MFNRPEVVELEGRVEAVPIRQDSRYNQQQQRETMRASRGWRRCGGALFRCSRTAATHGSDDPSLRHTGETSVTDSIHALRMRIVLLLAALGCLAGACARLDSPSSKFVIEQATATGLGTLGGQQSAALDINDAGTIVGWSASAQGVKRAFRFSSGMMEELLSAFAGSAAAMEATSINRDGAIAGHFINAQGQNRGLTWDAAINNAFPLQAGFGSACSHHSEAFAINDAGHVAGHRIFCDDVSYSQVTLWTDRVFNFQLEMESLPHWSSVAYDINLHDFVVGRSDDTDQMFRWQWVSG